MTLASDDETLPLHIKDVEYMSWTKADEYIREAAARLDDKQLESNWCSLDMCGVCIVVQKWTCVKFASARRISTSLSGEVF